MSDTPPQFTSSRCATIFFTDYFNYCACVLCDRDNLSPLKEFLDISSRVVSVAKTGLVKRLSDRSIASYYTHTHIHTHHLPLHPLNRSSHWADSQKSAARKKRTLVLTDRNYHLVHRSLQAILPPSVALPKIFFHYFYTVPVHVANSFIYGDKC